jgi:hypothetical protein
MPPDGSNESGVTRPLASLRSRLAMLDALRSIAVVAPLAVVSALVAIRVGAPAPASVPVVAGIAVVGAVLWLSRRSSTWSAAAAARAVERMHGDSRNVVVTAEELLRHPDRARPAIRERVLGQAAAILARDRRASVPLMRPAIAAGVSSAIAITLALGWPQRAVVVLQQTARDVATAIGGGEGAFSVRVIVTPPGYTGQPSRTVENPERIDVLEGSRMRVVLTRGDWRVRFGTEALAAKEEGSERFVDLAAIRSGYLAFEPTDPSQADKRRLVPVTVAPDRAPTIRIEAPAKDLLLPDATPTVRITATATDDLGLRSLDLRYTRISGSGEQFEFQEGTIPIAVAQESPRSWKARAELPLPKLSLDPGDSVVYRVVGRDQRAGDAGMATSDTFFIEIAGPNQVALPGFELPPEQERYAMSQQMIVLKLERLRAREKALDRPALEAEVATIAAEQRAVKSNFIFLTGGTVEDEEEEAEHSHEIQEGRLENTARREIGIAIQHMTLTEQALAQVSTTRALPPARDAVEALQRAFGRNRYFLKTLPVRSRVDPARRLTGELASASDWRRELFPSLANGQLVSANEILARVLEMAPALRAGAVQPNALTALAEQALVIDPASADWQRISRAFLDLREKMPANVTERATAANAIVASLSAVVQRQALRARPSTGGESTLAGAWGEERRRQ